MTISTRKTDRVRHRALIFLITLFPCLGIWSVIASFENIIIRLLFSLIYIHVTIPVYKQFRRVPYRYVFEKGTITVYYSTVFCEGVKEYDSHSLLFSFGQKGHCIFYVKGTGKRWYQRHIIHCYNQYDSKQWSKDTLIELKNILDEYGIKYNVST